MPEDPVKGFRLRDEGDDGHGRAAVDCRSQVRGFLPEGWGDAWPTARASSNQPPKLRPNRSLMAARPLSFRTRVPPPAIATC